MEFKLLNYRDPQACRQWDEFCLHAEDAWFWHLSTWLHYQVAYRPALKTKPLYYTVWRNSKIIAVCPIAMEQREAGNRIYHTFSLGGDALPSPLVDSTLFEADKERVYRALHDHIDQVAKENAVAKVSYRDAVLSPRILQPSKAPENRLWRFNYLDASVQTQILDLRKELPLLKSGLRKSYHSPIHRAEEKFQFRCLDAASCTQDFFDAYRHLHAKAAGHATRPIQTFELMFQWIQQGLAVLSQVFHENRIVAAAFISVYKNKAYYGSACTDPELEEDWALSHMLQWNTIQALKHRGVTHYELGWQFFGSQTGYVPTKDDLKIAFFKRGFGGDLYPIHAGRKYHDRDLFRQEYANIIEKISEALGPSIVVESHP